MIAGSDHWCSVTNRQCSPWCYAPGQQSLEGKGSRAVCKGCAKKTTKDDETVLNGENGNEDDDEDDDDDDDDTEYHKRMAGVCITARARDPIFEKEWQENQRRRVADRAQQRKRKGGDNYDDNNSASAARPS